MKEYRIAVLGATGAVGREMLRVLEEYQIPVSRLLPLASARSAGSTVLFRGQQIPVEEAAEERFRDLDFVLGAVGSGLSRQLRPAIERSGAIYIDNSSAFRLEEGVPLIVPEINGQEALSRPPVIANPNCSTIITLMAVAALHRLSPIQSMVACTYQAVSGAGQGGLVELEEQMQALAAGRPVEHRVFPAQIALNVIPVIGDRLENGYTAEEMKMQNEGRKILHQPELKVTCTCVRVPVARSHSISVTVRTRDRITPEQARAAIGAFPGVRVAEELDGRDYPTPLDAAGADTVWVGRIRDDLTQPNSLTLWCCGDQIRKGAAANAVQILKKIAEQE